MIRVALISVVLTIVLTLSGCVSLPDSSQQAIELGQQRFDSDYQFAIVSYYNDTQIASSTPNRIAESFTANTDREWLRILLASQQRQEDKERQLAAASQAYNLVPGVADIEQLFGDTLQTYLGVTPVYLSRAEIRRRLDQEFMESSAMMHAKAMAAEQNHDAVLVVYFQPLLAEVDGFPFGYQLTYEATVAARSGKADRLMYFVKRFYPCERKVISSASNANAFEAMKSCEQNIHVAIVEDFMEFAKSAGVVSAADTPDQAGFVNLN